MEDIIKVKDCLLSSTYFNTLHYIIPQLFTVAKCTAKPTTIYMVCKTAETLK